MSRIIPRLIISWGLYDFNLAIKRQMLPETSNQWYICEAVSLRLRMLRAYEVDRSWFTPGILYFETRWWSRYNMMICVACVSYCCHRYVIVACFFRYFFYFHCLIFKAYLMTVIKLFIYFKLYCKKIAERSQIKSGVNDCVFLKSSWSKIHSKEILF